VRFLSSSNLPTLSLPTFILQNYYKILILLPSFFPPLKLIIICLFKKLVEKKNLKLHENYFRGKRKLLMIRVRFLKRRRREVKVDQSLVANGMFHAWWPMEGSMLGG
jgi:hypothetical protein